MSERLGLRGGFAVRGAWMRLSIVALERGAIAAAGSASGCLVRAVFLPGDFLIEWLPALGADWHGDSIGPGTSLVKGYA